MLHNACQVFVYDGRLYPRSGQVELHQVMAPGKRNEVVRHYPREIDPVSSGQNPEAVQCGCAVPKGQLLHVQWTE